MEEYYSCMCGNGNWMLFNDRIECAACGWKVAWHVIMRESPCSWNNRLPEPRNNLTTTREGK